MGRSIRTRFAIGVLALVSAATLFAGGNVSDNSLHSDGCTVFPNNTCGPGGPGGPGHPGGEV